MWYFDLLPYELFSEIIKYIHDMKTYLLFISTINYRITPENRFTFKSNTLRINIKSTLVQLNVDKLRNVYLLPKSEDYVEFYNQDNVLLNMTININRAWELLSYQKIYTENLLFELS